MKIIKWAAISAALVVIATSVVVCSRSERSPMSMREEGYARSDSSPQAVGSAAPPAPPPPPQAGRAYFADGKKAKKDTTRGLVDTVTKEAAEPEPADEPQEAQAPGTDPPKPKRMLHYNGYGRLRVDSQRKAGDEAAKIAQAAGGFVEQLATTMITVRVPVAAFRETMTKLLKLGDVVDKSVTAEDVTDAFAAVELRLQTAKTSRDRLMQLLAKARTEREKLELLREIQRLTMEIDDLENASKALVSLANFSRISLVFEERSRQMNAPQDEPVAAFKWIHRLSAFSRDVSFGGKKLKLEIPQGFLQVDDKQHWITRSADDAVFWAAKLDNQPQGTTRFWVDALKSRLSPEFGGVEEKELGQFVVLRFVDRSDAPYRYLVGVRANGDTLELVEVHFPTEAEEKRYQEAIFASITKGAQ